MAFPATRRTTYIANSLPRIKADDLNRDQDSWANFLCGTSPTYTGGWTQKSISVDGTGGAANGVAAGSIQASGNVAAVGVHGFVSAPNGYLFAGEYLDLTTAIAISSATAGAGQGVAVGKLYKDTAPIAWATFKFGAAWNNAVTLRRSANIQSITGNAAGKYTIVLVNGAPNELCVIPQFIGDTGDAATAGFQVRAKPGGTNQFEIYIMSDVGVLTDLGVTAGVALVVFGG